jgi:hypothetical protein
MKMEGRINNKAIILLVVILTCFYSCSKNDKIVKYLQNDCKFINDTCIINLSEVIGVEWERAHVIYEWRPAWDIGNEIGFEYRGKAGGFNVTTVIFVKDNRVVYEELQRDYRRVFSIYDSAAFRRRLFYNVPYQAVRIKRDNGEYYYNLYPIE